MLLKRNALLGELRLFRAATFKNEQIAETGALRQDAELPRDRCEFAERRETARNTARSRWEGQRQSGLGAPMPSSQER